jgi:hypothetical protein
MWLRVLATVDSAPTVNAARNTHCMESAVHVGVTKSLAAMESAFSMLFAVQMALNKYPDCSSVHVEEEVFMMVAKAMKIARTAWFGTSGQGKFFLGVWEL